MTPSHPTSSIVWGHARLLLEHPAVVEGYLDGRQYYFESCAEQSRRVHILTATDLLWLVATPDADGQFRLDSDLPLEEQLGFVLGYLSGPLAPDPVAEAKAREDYRELTELERSPESICAPCVAWGRVQFYLDQQAFQRDYQDGRLSYFEACLYHPERKTQLCEDALLFTIAYREGEHYRLDPDCEHGFTASLGFFVGYLSGPLYAQTQQEQVMILPAMEAVR